VLTFELEQTHLMKHKFSFLFWIGSLFSWVVFVSYSLRLHLQPFWLFVVASETYSLLMHLLWCVETKRIVRRCNVCFSSFGVCFFCLQKKLDAKRWRIDVASMNFFFDSISCRSSAFVKGLVLLSMMKRKNCVVFGHSKLWKRLRCFFFLFCRKRTRQMFILSAEQCSLVNCYSFLRFIFHVYTAFSCSW